MAHVIVLDSLNEDIFVCGVCKSVFNSLPTFLEHKKFKCTAVILENLNTPIVAQATEATVASNSFIENSLRIESNIELDTANNEDKQTNDFSCSSCKKSFKKLKSLQSHMKMHNEKPYQCPICGRTFIQNSHLQRHINIHKIWPYGFNHTTVKSVDADLLSYNCPYCNIVLPNYSLYRAHLKTHCILKKFKCIQGDCTSLYDSVESLIQHVNDSHDHLIYTCYICSTVYNNLEDLAIHQTSHIGSVKENKKKKKLLKCSQCDAEFHKQDKLALHMLTDDHKKVCIHCNKIFASDKRLRLHLQIHRKLKPFECNICASSFHMKKYLTTHMLKHGERQFKCNICKYTFKRSDLLQRHMRLHQTKKIYKCPFKDSLDCKKEFSRSDKLKLHLKSHTKNVSKSTNKSNLI